MTSHAQRAAEIEASFLAGAEANLNQAKEQRFRGTKWLWASASQEDLLRDLMASRQCYDRELLRSLPRNAARIMTCIEPNWFIWERPVTIAIAACVSPLEYYVTQTLSKSSADGQADGPSEPPPAGIAEVTACIKRLAGDWSVAHVVGVCSTTGFTEEVKTTGIDMPNLTLVLVEPRPDGGWKTTCASPNARPSDARLFDPEPASRKIVRIREEVGSRRADLLTGGISASSIASRLGLTTSMVGRVFENMLTSDRELRVSWQGDDVLLYLGAPAAMEESAMSMVEWIRTLFSGEGEEARKINVLTERRAKLATRRDRLYEDVGKLEAREAELMKQGRENASSSVKRRVATQVKQLRDDMDRMHAAARMIGQQVDVISTHVHNLTLIQQGQAAKLPSTEELTQDAVRAEELLEQLGAEVELASSLGATGREAGLTDDELQILRELEAPTERREAAKPAVEATREASPSALKAEPQPDRGEPQAG